MADRVGARRLSSSDLRSACEYRAMLIRDDGASWTAITQPAHAHLAGQIARHWVNAPGPDFVLGVVQHDVPWVQWDREPPLHAPEHRAAAFYEAPAERRLEIWRHAGGPLEAQSPYAALLVSLHATNIHTRYYPEDSRPLEFLAEQRADQDALLAVLPDVTREQAEAAADALFAFDALSLNLCNHWDARELPPFDGMTIQLTPQSANAATLDPWPLAVPELTVGIYTRTLTERFDDEAPMQQALAATANAWESWRLTPA
jgi:hypothetical protein